MKWAENETNKLIELYGVNTNKELCVIFNKSYLSIYKKAYSLGLKKTKEISFRTSSESHAKEKSGSWKGGRKTTLKGYIQVLAKEHPNCDMNGYVLEHRLIMENQLGRILNSNEVVHHKNGIKNDNRIENLLLMFKGQHSTLHNCKRIVSEKTKAKLSKSTKARFIHKENHPSYKNVDVSKMIQDRNNGYTVRQICSKYKICKKTFYNKYNQWRE